MLPRRPRPSTTERLRLSTLHDGRRDGGIKTVDGARQRWDARHAAPRALIAGGIVLCRWPS